MIQDTFLSNFDMNHYFILESPSGTGKTAAFSIGLLQTILWKYPDPTTIDLPTNSILGLVMVHSAELALQVTRELQHISRHLPFDIVGITGSFDLMKDWEELIGAHIVVGTPGVIKKMVQKRKIKLDFLLGIAIDEWDKVLLDDLLSSDLLTVCKTSMPNLKMLICSSATYSSQAFDKIYKLFQVPFKKIDAMNQQSLKKAQHYSLRTGNFNKRIANIIHLFHVVDFHQALIFCNIHQLANDCQAELDAAGFPSYFLSAKSTPQERSDRVGEFRDIEFRVLITTDLVARGLDIGSVNIVINLDFPHDAATFLHRIGRCGRFGTEGMSLTFFKRKELSMLTEMSNENHIELLRFNFADPPKIKLQPLENELLIQNLSSLKKKVLPVEETYDVPELPYCNLEGSYWKEQIKKAALVKPPFVYAPFTPKQ